MSVVMRRAELSDLPALVDLLADDALGQAREDTSRPLVESYREAFAAINRDPNQYLAVAQYEGAVVGCLQLTFLPGLSRRGQWRCQIESVRVAASHRNLGIGAQMMAWALAQARVRSCGVAQLTTDKTRADAHRFYERLGFVASHEGMKLAL